MALSAVLGAAVRADEPEGAVWVVRVDGAIDLGLAPFLARVLDEAEAARAGAVVLEIDTPGGRLDAVLQMRDALLGTPVRTIAFVDRSAFSAGALIALAAGELHMAPAAAMGAATPVVADGQTADPKVVSAVRSTFRATAEVRGRDPRLAEAMVDPAVAVEGVVAAGELLTLTEPEAAARGYNDGTVADRTALLQALGLADAPVVEVAPAAAERLVRLLTHPAVATVLITLAILLIVGDFLVGGLGLAALGGLGLLGLFFWGHLLAGLAGWEDLALVLLGLVLIAVELLVVPGFGIAGLLGLGALLGGLFMAMVGRDVAPPEQLQRAALSVGAALVVSAGGLVAVGSLLARGRRPGSLVLRARLGAATPVARPAGGGWLRWFGGGEALNLPGERPGDRAAGRRAPDGHRPPDRDLAPGSLTGATGVALSDLRPGGVADLGGRRVDVVTGGEFIPSGAPIEVVKDERYRRVVRRQPEQTR